MTAAAILKSMVPESLRHGSHGSGPHHRHGKRSDHADTTEPNGRRTESEQDDDFEHVEREQSYEHVSHTDSNSEHHRQPSVPSEIEQFDQSDRPLTPNEIVQDTSQKQLGGSAPKMKVTDFELIKTLGTGTFARVWLARFKDGSKGDRNKVFALKVLRKVDVVRLKQVEHVQNERKTLSAAAGHPFITTLVLTFKDRDCVYMLLEYCPGGEVFTYLRRARKFEEPAAKFYAAEMTLVFEFLHEKQGIAYRDLKPENILLDEYGHIKLVDFGFAKKLDHQETYTLCGTPEYLAPEVIKNQGHGMGADWWALGILIYEFLVGQPPFWDHNPMKIYHQICECNLRFPTEPPLGDDAKDIISKFLRPNPSERLGCINGGAQTVKDHPWFACVDWDQLYNKRMDGPIMPKVKHAADAGNFDDYPDEDVKGRREYSHRMKSQWDAAFKEF